jgi:hypothetical protein
VGGNCGEKRGCDENGYAEICASEECHCEIVYTRGESRRHSIKREAKSIELRSTDSRGRPSLHERDGGGNIKVPRFARDDNPER